MFDRKKILSALRLSGIYSLAIGFIHMAITPLILFKGFESLIFENLSIFIYVYLMTGLALIFSGRVLMLCATALRNGDSWPQPIAWSAAVFVFLAAVGALLSMPYNPISYLILLSALISLVTLWVYGHEV